MNKSFFSRVAVVVVGLMMLTAPLLAQAAAQVVDMQLVSSVRYDRTHVDYTYKAVVQNGSPALSAVTATVSSSAATTQVVRASIAIGDMAAGITATSSDTIAIRQDRSVAFDPTVLTWTVAGTPVAVGPASVSFAISEPFVAPGGSITLKPTVLDADGNPVDASSLTFEVTATPVGTVTGAAPVVGGLSVSFPKLAKTLVNQNAAVDPAGEFADTNPADPNYGKETGGRYQITLRVNGTALSSSQEVWVLPTGTAGITFKASRYAGDLQSALATAQEAYRLGDATRLAGARAALDTIRANGDYSYDVLSVTRAFAPADGYIPKVSQLTAAGFAAGSQDAAYATALVDVMARIRTAKAQVKALDVANLTESSLQSLQDAADAYRASLATLKTLQLSTLGTVQQEATLNQMLATELPQLLDAIKAKSAEMLSAVSVTGSLTPDGHASPLAMYADTRQVQLWDVWTWGFSILTDLAGTARGNIIEGTLALMSSLINIMTANIINSNSPGGLSIDYTLASSSMAYVCPAYMPTRVGCSGNVGTDAAAFRTVLIGCVQSDLMRSILTLSVPRNLAAGIRLANKIVSIAQGIANLSGMAAVTVPDFVDYDDFGLATYMLYYGSGWPAVSTGRLPCVGIVIIVNTATGSFVAENRNFLGRCG